MRKKVLISILVIIVLLGGCHVSFDQSLSYHNLTADQSIVNNNPLPSDMIPFFSDNLAVVREQDNLGEDPLIDAGASLMINHTENEVLFASNAYKKLYPASLTKLMTALVVIKQAELTDIVTVSYNASHIKETAAKTCGLREGDMISLDALLHCLLIYSGNDAAIAIAEHVGGSESAFIEKMNETAKQIGAVNTNFINPHGLHHDDQYTTAYDMYLIFHELVQYDKFLSIISMDRYEADYVDSRGNSIQKTFQTTNWYFSGTVKPIDDFTILGGKTGTTSKAGNCLVLFSRDDTKDIEYISIILKASSNTVLYNQMNHLLTYSKK